MTTTTQYFAWLAGVFSIGAYFPYLIAIWSDRHKPNSDPTKCMPKRASWFIWFTTSWIIAVTMQANSSQFAIWQAWAYAVGASLTLFLSIPYGEGGWKISDRITFLTALSGLFFWWKFNSAWYAFAIALSVDAVGIIPIIKARGKGESTLGWTLWFLGTLANIGCTFGLSDRRLSPENKNLADLVYSYGMTAIVVLPTAYVWYQYFKNRKMRREDKQKLARFARLASLE